jgi:hypothetical protein
MSEYTYNTRTEDIAGQLEVVIRRSDGLWIPVEPANTDYQEYLAWLEEGNVAEEWNTEEVE